jgi:hypothetical protein
LFGNTRFLAQASIGNVPHQLTMKSIELFGTKVAPVIRKELGNMKTITQLKEKTGIK